MYCICRRRATMRGRTAKTGAGRRGLGSGRREDGSWETRGCELGDGVGERIAIEN